MDVQASCDATTKGLLSRKWGLSPITNNKDTTGGTDIKRLWSL